MTNALELMDTMFSWSERSFGPCSLCGILIDAWFASSMHHHVTQNSAMSAVS